jgi:hypothetical protein
MPFQIAITKFTRGEHRASLLRIDPIDPWLGLVSFGGQGRPEWVNAAYLAALGWRPVL